MFYGAFVWVGPVFCCAFLVYYVCAQGRLTLILINLNYLYI